MPQLAQACWSGQPHSSDEHEALVRRLSPSVEYYAWDDTGHFLMMERAEEFNRVVGEFVARLGASTY